MVWCGVVWLSESNLNLNTNQTQKRDEIEVKCVVCETLN